MTDSGKKTKTGSPSMMSCRHVQYSKSPRSPFRVDCLFPPVSLSPVRSSPPSTLPPPELINPLAGQAHRAPPLFGTDPILHSSPQVDTVAPPRNRRRNEIRRMDCRRGPAPRRIRRPAPALKFHPAFTSATNRKSPIKSRKSIPFPQEFPRLP
jgi:hypothetical protein